MARRREVALFTIRHPERLVDPSIVNGPPIWKIECTDTQDPKKTELILLTRDPNTEGPAVETDPSTSSSDSTHKPVLMSPIPRQLKSPDTITDCCVLTNLETTSEEAQETNELNTAGPFRDEHRDIRQSPDIEEEAPKEAPSPTEIAEPEINAFITLHALPPTRAPLALIPLPPLIQSLTVNSDPNIFRPVTEQVPLNTPLFATVTRLPKIAGNPCNEKAPASRTESDTETPPF